MKFAHFAHVWGKAGMTPAQRYAQLWRELELADQVGFDYGFCVEHHFRPDESWMSSPALYTVAAGARTKRIRLGGMGSIVPLHNPLRLIEELGIVDQMLDGRLEIGLVPGISLEFFTPFKVDYASRREVTLEFVHLLKTAFAGQRRFNFKGKYHDIEDVILSVMPVQQPHPPLWIETRDPATLEFCAREGINAGYFFLFPRAQAAPRYRVYLDQWRAAGWKHKPQIGYSCIVYVDETDARALEKLEAAGRAYRGFLLPTEDPAQLKTHIEERAKFFEQRGETGAAEVMRHIVDAQYQHEHTLLLIGSPATVAAKLRAISAEGLFNCFFGEFNFGDLPEADLMRSIRLFGTEVIPRLRDFEPF